MWINVLYLVIGILLGGAGGFFAARWYLQKELKKNPPINEKMIRAMYMQMGRKPSEAQIKQIVNSMNRAK